MPRGSYGRQGPQIPREGQRLPGAAQASKMLGGARPLAHHPASLGSGLLSGAWSMSPGLWQNTAEMFEAGLGPTWWLLWPEPPLHRALSVRSLLSHKLIFLSLGKFLFPPRRLVSLQACLRRLQPASHTGLSCSAQGAQSRGRPPLARDGTDGKPAVPTL